MKILNSIAKAANTILMIFVTLAAAVMLVSGLYVLNDILYTNRTAFTSYDLLQYRPKLQNKEEDAAYTYKELKEINPGTVGWIEMFDTNINYPVVQGNDNLEYLNKDIFGYSTLSGSIYLAAENNSDLSDWYNMIYGHHMDNGAMFGDIEKYLDPDFFASHRDGIIQTAQGDYSIHVFACVRTNAYEDAVYQLQDDAADHYPILKDYIAEHAVNKTDVPADLQESHLLGMSTCTDAVTDGRIVLFASVAPWDDAADGDAAQRITAAEKDTAAPEHLTAIGHKLQNNKWAFLNLMCLVCTFLTLLPLWALGRKFGQFSYAKKMCKKLKEQINKEQETNPDGEEKNSEKQNQVIRDLKHFLRKGRIGLIAELIILIISAIAFILTEDLTSRMVIRDRWTGLMILIAAAALLTDFVFLRYRGSRPEESVQNDIPQQTNS